jgi:hypothetical protein
MFEDAPKTAYAGRSRRTALMITIPPKEEMEKGTLLSGCC